MQMYKPYKSDKPDKKYYIITKSGKRIYFGDSNYQDYTQHKDEVRKNSYIQRHKKTENWNDPDTSGYWAVKFLWSYPTKTEALNEIQKDLKRKGYL